MADQSLNYLNYGHPAAANFDLEKRKWAFARQYTTTHLQQVRTSRVVQVPETTIATQTCVHLPTPQTAPTPTSVRKDVSRYIGYHPQLAPAVGLLPKLALVSAAVLRTTSTYDPLIGSLLSFGSITLEDKHEDPRRIAALPTGEGGNVLRLAFLNKERLGWGTDRSIWVDGPSLKDAECGFWNNEASPIQQVCFAQTEERSTLLAVRLPTRTVLFRPVYHRRSQAAGQSPFYHLPPSTIEAHPILSIGLDDTGGAPHADVAFNPDFQLQIAIVDQNQTWSVWDIEKKRKSDTYAISCLVLGNIGPSEDMDTAGEDGWSRILWVGDVSTLLVCSRRHLSIISIRGGSPAHLPCPPPFSDRSTARICDVKRHPRHKGRFFVLTSTHLTLMAVTTSGQASNASSGEEGATTLLSWRHYRGAGDWTLQISVQMLADDESCVVLHSQLNNLTQVYTFNEPPFGSSALISSSDPSVLNLTIDGSERITEIHMEAMHYGHLIKKGCQPGPGRSYMEKDIAFYRLFAVGSDLAVHEAVVYTRQVGADASTDGDQLVEDFSRSAVRRPRRDMTKREVIKEEDEFIFPDGPIVLDVPRSKTASQRPKWGQIRDRNSSRRPVDHSLLCDALAGTDNGDEGISNSVDFAVATSQLKRLLEGDLNSPTLPLGTLMDFANMEFVVSDVDEASMHLQELFPSEDRQDVEIQRIASARLLDLAEDGEPTMADVYDSILRNWVAPLPANVPVPVRQHKERLARRVAAELMFASICIRQHEPQEPIAESQQGPSHDSGFALPILPSKPSQGAFDNTSPWSFSQPLPTSPYSLPSSSMPASSPPSAPSNLPTPPDTIAHLWKHIQIGFTDPAKMANVNNYLTHWQSGSDPRTYDYETIERTFELEDLDEESQQQREKQRKKKERREKRQQRQDELMRAKTASQPVVYPRSSPGPVLGAMGSSSQIPSKAYTQPPIPGVGFRGPGGHDILAPFSQVEPGKFGGRLDKKKKKKGRVSGF